jgi:hypothetical protein
MWTYKKTQEAPTMFITYGDELGQVVVEVDADGVSFVDGFAYFSDGSDNYKIETARVVSING